MSTVATRGDAARAGEGGAPAPRIIAAWGFDRRKTWPFMAMLVVLVLLGLGRVWVDGLAGNWLAVFLLIGLPGLALVMIGRDLRIRGPVILVTQEGLVDRRRGDAPVPWHAIEQAEAKRRPFIRHVRVKLVDGERYDLELDLVDAEPEEVMAAMKRMLEPEEGGEVA